VFSDEKIRELAREFVTVKLDPRESSDAGRFKATRFVPEVVFLTSKLRVINRLAERSVAGVRSTMQRVLRRAGVSRGY
jgi:hypothetical protein